MGLKTALHVWLDPLLSLPDHWQARQALADLPDGTYYAPVKVPYYAQFASPERIYDYIHNGYDSTQDPNWADFGAGDPAEYAFWAPRICALACLKMAIEAFHPHTQPSLWQLVKQGLAFDGYTVRDKHGHWVDQGWYYQAQVKLAARYGLRATGRPYAAPASICAAIQQGALVAATVTPELGERDPSGSRYGGHMVLVFGFMWQDGRPTHYILHNPSGRFPELRANAAITADRFHASFAHRFVMLQPQP
jgi:hypothetical protein